MLTTFAENPQQLWTLLVQVSLFGLIAAVWFAGVTFWYLRRSRREQELEARLGMREQAQRKQRVLRLWHGDEVSETVVPAGTQRSVLERLEQLREAAGWQLPMPTILGVVALAAVVAFALAMLLLGNPLLGLAASAVILIGFRGYLASCVGKRSALLEKQLVDAIDLGARSLRAGHPLSGAFRLIAEEIEAPIGSLFAEVVEQESLGVSVQEALRQAAERSRSPDMRIFAASVIIQLRSGGNLADMMERVTWVIRERMRLNRRARVLTTEAQLSKWVLLALPLGLFVFLNIIRPEYMELFFTTFWGQLMAVVAAISMLIGGWVMGRMAELDY